ncbi:MAG: hypothetical protein KAJ23_09275 [Maribacter sp.]|nr:hypothetical protein [Maribacter sp.]
MNTIYTIIISILFFLPSNTEDHCEVVYNIATYALSHSKKALKANNFEHQLYYSGKTLESYKKITKDLGGCDCQDLNEMVEDILYDAKKAADPVDWDRGRYYSKKVYKSTQELITALDLWADSKLQTESAQEIEQ